MKKLTSIFFIFFFAFIGLSSAQNLNQTQTGFFLNNEYTYKMGGEIFFSSDTGVGISGTSYGARLIDMGTIGGQPKPSLTIGKGIGYITRPTQGRIKYWLINTSPYHSLINFAFSVGNDSGSYYWNSTSTNINLGATNGFQTVTFPISAGGVLNCNQFYLSFHSPLPEGNNLQWLFYFGGVELLVGSTWITIDGGTGTAQIPPTPTFLNPSDGYVFTSLPGCFDWQTSSNVVYQYQVTNAANFSTLLINQTVSGNSYCISNLPNGYYWAGLKARYSNQPTWALSGRGIRNFGIQVPVGITQNGNEIPKEFLLKQNYPNPFNPITNISFDIPNSGNIKLAVYDIIGKEVAVLINKTMDAGRYTADWNASAFSSGMYFYRLEADGFTMTKKMTLIK